MKAKHRRLLESLPKSPLAVPAVGPTVGKKDISRALRCHPSQAKEANEVAQSMGCGTPFRSDGMFEDTRANKNRYLREVNKRAVDNGEDRMVNFDGGYGDVT